MARYQIPRLSKRPPELLDHDYDVEWSNFGQQHAKKMAKYVFDALAISPDKQPQIPRILAYEALTQNGGWETLPMFGNAGGMFFSGPNFIALLVPTSKTQGNEYDFIAKSSIIGNVVGSRKKIFLLDLSHEMAHFCQDKILNKPRSAAHGRIWRLAYSLLRERFVNHLK